MFECNDKNLLLILGIGVIVLLLLKIMCSNNNNISKNNFINNSENVEYNDDNNEYFTSENNYKNNNYVINQPIKEHYTQNVNSNPVEKSEKSEKIEKSEPIQQVSEQVTIKVPIINDDIFQPKNIEWDYGDANNNDYTLNVKDNPMDVNKKGDKLTSGDLLPGKSNEKWFENPDVGIKIEDANLLSDAVQKVGVDTVGQTRKNPSYDIRGTVPCPKFQISPWNNSTTEPDYNLKSLY
jgi:hypothetical protein